MASNFTSMYLQMKLKDPRRHIPRSASGARCNKDVSPASSPANPHSSPSSAHLAHSTALTDFSANQRSVNPTPVVAIAPTKTVRSPWRSMNQQPESTTRSSSNESHQPSEQLLKQEKSFVSPHTGFYLQSGASSDVPHSPVSIQRPIPRVVSAGTRTDSFLPTLRPYPNGDEQHSAPSLHALSLDPAAVATYFHPAILSQHIPFQRPVSRFEDPYISAFRTLPFHLPDISSYPTVSIPFPRHSQDIGNSTLTTLRSTLKERRKQNKQELKRKEKRSKSENESVHEFGVPRETRQRMMSDWERKQNELEWKKLFSSRQDMKDQTRPMEMNSACYKYSPSKELQRQESEEQYLLPSPNIIPSRYKGASEYLPPWNLLPPYMPGRSNDIQLSNRKPPALTTDIHSPSSPTAEFCYLTPSLFSFSESGQKVALKSNGLRHHRQTKLLERNTGLLMSHQELKKPNDTEEKEVDKKMNIVGSETFSISIDDEDRKLQKQSTKTSIPSSSWHPTDKLTSSQNPCPVMFALDFSTQRSHNTGKDDEITTDKEHKYTDESRTNQQSIQTEHQLCNKGEKVPQMSNTESSSTLQDARDARTFPYRGSTCHMSSSDQGQLHQECLDLSSASSVKTYEHTEEESATRWSNSKTSYGSTGNEDAPFEKPVKSKLDLLEIKQKESLDKGISSHSDTSYEETGDGSIQKRCKRLVDLSTFKKSKSPRKLQFLERLGLTAQKRHEMHQQKLRQKRMLLPEHNSDLASCDENTLPSFTPIAKPGSPQLSECGNTTCLMEKKKLLTLLQPKLSSFSEKHDRYGPCASSDVQQEGPVSSTELSDSNVHQNDDKQTSGSEEEEEKDRPQKWQGIEALFENYQDYLEECELEMSVLHKHLKYLQAKYEELNATEQHLTTRMTQLKACREKLDAENQHYQDTTDFLKNCLNFVSSGN
ncbi:genetic suppressor element 1-like isoform X2 [Protopterus annectens]|uniref:genetic suppressor element 1-like isoform X2 n=1 Tax=Protopterus annectens TaxID=7888 RepID=UPI001CF97A04|nr:genetic suppressor element 1-like isoform X2 [Protopterus annectens]